MAEKNNSRIHSSTGEDLTSDFTTTAVVGIAVALLKREWLPGMAVGVAAVLLPRMLPTLGTPLRTLMKTVVRAGYSTLSLAREIAAEAGEQLQDIVAEVNAEQADGSEKRNPRPPTRRPTRA